MRLIEKARAVLHAWTRPAPAPADVIELAQWLYDNGGVGSGSFQDALAESRRVWLSLLDGSLSAPPATAAPPLSAHGQPSPPPLTRGSPR